MRPVIRSLAVFLLSGLSLAGIAHAQSVTVVATGLDNPRGVAISPNGTVYVAEAGTGGTVTCIPAPTGGQRCYGESGAITRIDGILETTRVLSGLPSLATASGTEATGPHDIAFQGNQLYFTIGWGGAPAGRNHPNLTGLMGGLFGTLNLLRHDGRWSVEQDLAAYENSDPNNDGVDSNPYGLITSRGRRIVVDAGGNSLLEVAANSSIRTLATFADGSALAPPFLGLPPGTRIPTDAVPTSVAEAPDGSYYVGQLTGFPFPPGGANVYKVPAKGGAPVVYASGFTNIIDVAVDRDGALYVLELSSAGLLSGNLTGRLVRVDPVTRQQDELLSDLFAPGGIAIDKNGSLYITVGSILPGGGQLIRVDQ